MLFNETDNLPARLRTPFGMAIALKSPVGF